MFVASLGELTPLELVMVAIARYLIVVIPASLAIAWLGDHRRDAFVVFVATVVAIVIAEVLALGYSHPPPHLQGVETILENEPGNAFPSDHAAAIVGFALATWYVSNVRLGLIAITIAVLIGIARVYTGLHFPIDIVGGLVAGALAIVMVHLGRKPIDAIFERVRSLERTYLGAIPVIGPRVFR